MSRLATLLVLGSLALPGGSVLAGPTGEPAPDEGKRDEGKRDEGKRDETDKKDEPKPEEGSKPPPVAPGVEPQRGGSPSVEPEPDKPGVEPEPGRSGGGVEPEPDRGGGGVEPDRGGGGVEPEPDRGGGGVDPQPDRGGGGVDPQPDRGGGGVEPDSGQGGGTSGSNGGQGGGSVEPGPAPREIEPRIHTDVEPVSPDSDESKDDDIKRLIIKPLPNEGLALRPTLPYVDRDMIHYGEAAVGQGQAYVSIDTVGEDTFLFFNLGVVIVHEQFRIAPRIPIRFRIIDNEPHTEKVVREEDWDEPGDFARILAYFQYGTVGEPLFLRVGELNGLSVGHGSIVNRYFNTIDIDHYQGGVYFVGDAGIFGGEVMIDNLLQPNVVALRPYVRPLIDLDDLPLLVRGLKLGLTLALDFDAPLEVRTDLNNRIIYDDQFRPKVLDSDVLPMLGLDLELPIVSSPHFDLVPYLDFATVDFLGAGLHLGAFVNIRFSEVTELRTRVEYRFQSPHYEAGYISPFYEIQRLSHGQHEPKLWWLRNDGVAMERNGFHVEAELRSAPYFRLSVVFADSEGEDNSDLMARLRLHHLGPFSLTVFFGRIGFDGLDDIGDSRGTIVAGSLRVNIYDLFFVKCNLSNEWWLKHNADGTGTYQTTFDYSFGAGLLLKLW